MTETALENVGKLFGSTVALDAINVQVGDGELLVLLGPTGAGKTTTLRLIAGLEMPDQGRVRIGGVDVTRMPPAARDVAFVFQQYSLYPHYSVFQNLAFPLRAPGRRLGETAIRKRVGDIAAMLRIEHKLDSRAVHLSGGEMQRVSIGRALVREPNVFLMDEPLSSLDARLREDLRVELKRIQHDLGATLVYVTHDQLEAMTLADRIGILDQGRLIQIDAPRTIYERPATVHAARRLGRPAINLVPTGKLGLAAPTEGCATVGVRPEDILIGSAEGSPARLAAVERLGAGTIALFDVDGCEQIRALSDAPSALAPGTETRIAVRPGAAIWFDSDGRRLDV